MFHKCVKCGQVYEKGSNEILNGCVCGNRLFFFVKNKNSAKKFDKLKSKNKEKLNDELQEIFEENMNEESPVVLDIETIKIISPGKYEIDINALMNKQGIVYSFDEGKYSVDLNESFNLGR